MKNKIYKALSIVLMTAFMAGCTSPRLDMPQDEVPGEIVREESDDNDITNEDNTDPLPDEDKTGAEDNSEENVPDEAKSEAGDGTDQEADAAPENTSPESEGDDVTEAEPEDEAPPFDFGYNEPVLDGYMNIVFIGDSQFDRHRNEYNSIPEVVGAMFNSPYANMYNLGIGGTTCAIERSQTDTTYGSDYEEPNFTAICRMLKGDISPDQYSQLSDRWLEDFKKVRVTAVDYFVIEYGWNDYYNGLDMKYDDDPYSEHTFAGALRTGIMILRELNPHAKLIICTPCYCRFYNGSGADMGDAFTVSKGIGSLAQYANEATLIADDTENCIKFNSMSGTVLDLDKNTYKDYLEDNVHLSIYGRRAYAAALMRYIKYDLGLANSDDSIIHIKDYIW